MQGSIHKWSFEVFATSYINTIHKVPHFSPLHLHQKNQFLSSQFEALRSPKQKHSMASILRRHIVYYPSNNYHFRLSDILSFPQVSSPIAISFHGILSSCEVQVLYCLGKWLIVHPQKGRFRRYHKRYLGLFIPTFLLLLCCLPS